MSCTRLWKIPKIVFLTNVKGNVVGNSGRRGSCNSSSPNFTQLWQLLNFERILCRFWPVKISVHGILHGLLRGHPATSGGSERFCVRPRIGCGTTCWKFLFIAVHSMINPLSLKYFCLTECYAVNIVFGKRNDYCEPCLNPLKLLVDFLSFGLQTYLDFLAISSNPGKAQRDYLQLCCW